MLMSRRPLGSKSIRTICAAALSLAAAGPIWADIVIVSDDAARENGLKAYLESLYTAQTVTVVTDYQTLDASKIANLNAADLVVVSRNTDSGQYDDGTEVADWNGITTPMMLTNPFLVRSSRWQWIDSTNLLPPNTVTLRGPDPADPDPLLSWHQGPYTDWRMIDSANPGNGAALAYDDNNGDGALSGVVADPNNDFLAVVTWDAGLFYTGGGTAAGPRTLFTLDGYGGSAQDDFDTTLTADGLAAFEDSLDRLLPIPEPGSLALVGLGGLVIGLRRRD
jgi:hypothetical protein